MNLGNLGISKIDWKFNPNSDRMSDCNRFKLFGGRGYKCKNFDQMRLNLDLLVDGIKAMTANIEHKYLDQFRLKSTAGFPWQEVESEIFNEIEKLGLDGYKMSDGGDYDVKEAQIETRVFISYMAKTSKDEIMRILDSYAVPNI